MDDPEKLFVRTEKIYGMSADGTHADSAAIHITYANQLDETRMLKNVVLWSPQQPKLYPIKVGELTVKHGVRSFSYDAKRGFLLNGQPTLINGACVHHDNGVIDESFDGWYAEKSKYDYHMVIASFYQQDIAAMVLRDRNHPSIISYSIGNSKR